ncbi:MAG: biopolymer transporter ExbD [Sphaerochaetaceae bacterium]
MRKRRNQSVAQPSDIAFLLIIFFLLLAGIESSKAITLEQTGKVVSKQQTCVVMLQTEGIFYQEKAITLSACFSLFSECDNIQLYVDSEVSWQQVVDILSVANQCGKEVQLYEA